MEISEDAIIEQATASDEQYDEVNGSKGHNDPEESFCRRMPLIGLMMELYEKYDATFITMLGM